ncbi:hypothetical protein [Ralstonia wenshanensis]|uniref:hypothetical protein n=1 Tax=Ralstonia wenshanensis TaxID=2842456 RepID=UPI00292E92CE|nr:hypothetical protein [Ralstonia wenshanensis]
MAIDHPSLERHDKTLERDRPSIMHEPETVKCEAQAVERHKKTLEHEARRLNRQRSTVACRGFPSHPPEGAHFPNPAHVRLHQI